MFIRFELRTAQRVFINDTSSCDNPPKTMRGKDSKTTAKYLYCASVSSSFQHPVSGGDGADPSESNTGGNAKARMSCCLK